MLSSVRIGGRAEGYDEPGQEAQEGVREGLHSAPPAALHHVAGQHGGGDGADARGDGAYGLHDRLHGLEIDVAHQPALRLGVVYADVYDRLAGRKVLRRQRLGPAEGGDDDVGAAGDLRKVSVREWQMVTVALRCMSSMATGRPMTRLRPTTAARFPSICTP